MSSEITGLEGKLSDELSRLCDALSEIRIAARKVQTELSKLVDKKEVRVARRMIGAESIDLLRIAHDR